MRTPVGSLPKKKRVTAPVWLQALFSKVPYTLLPEDPRVSWQEFTMEMPVLNPPTVLTNGNSSVVRVGTTRKKSRMGTMYRVNTVLEAPPPGHVPPPGVLLPEYRGITPVVAASSPANSEAWAGP